jgi:CheY-like chemotaxis protein
MTATRCCSRRTAPRRWRFFASRMTLVQMPVMSGDAFLLARSADRKLRAIPVCIVSADPDAHAKAVGLGVSCMLRKPFLIDELFQVIAAFCDPRER